MSFPSAGLIAIGLARARGGPPCPSDTATGGYLLVGWLRLDGEKPTLILNAILVGYYQWLGEGIQCNAKLTMLKLLLPIWLPLLIFFNNLSMSFCTFGDGRNQTRPGPVVFHLKWSMRQYRALTKISVIESGSVESVNISINCCPYVSHAGIAPWWRLSGVDASIQVLCVWSQPPGDQHRVAASQHRYVHRPATRDQYFKAWLFRLVFSLLPWWYCNITQRDIHISLLCVGCIFLFLSWGGITTLIGNM